MKIYIAGKIAGDSEYKEKFARAENSLGERGNIVLNPAVLPEGMQSADYMRICFAMIDCADAVALLPDHGESKGARLEHSYCDYVGKKIIFLRDVPFYRP